MLADIRNKDIRRDTFIAVESLRNSQYLVNKHMGEWTSMRLSFVRPLGRDKVRELHFLNTALGMIPETAALLAEEYELRFVEGRLRVSSECITKPALFPLSSKPC